MIAALMAAALATGPATPAKPALSGDWVVVSVRRVIAPENMPGQCFVQAQIDQVVHGQSYRAGQPVYISLACRRGGVSPASAELNRIAGPEPKTIQVLKETKRALAHLDAGARVVNNEYYGAAAMTPLRP